MNNKKIYFYMLIGCAGFVCAAEDSSSLHCALFRDMDSIHIMRAPVSEALNRGVYQKYRYRDGRNGERVLIGFQFRNGVIKYISSKDFPARNGKSGTVKGSVCVLSKLPVHPRDSLDFIVRMPLRLAQGCKDGAEIRDAQDASKK